VKYKKQVGLVTHPELRDLSKTKTLFVDGVSAARMALDSKDALVHGDVTGMCDFLLAKGHTKRLYDMIADVTISH